MKVKRSIPKLNFNGTSAYMALMVICLFMGLVFGCVFVINSNHIPFANFLNLEITSISTGATENYSFFNTFFTMAKYPIIVFVLGFTAFGQILIPAAVFIKGFMLSFSISTLIGSIGKSGVFIALSMFGFQSLISIPCLLVVSTLSFETSKAFASVLARQTVPNSRKQKPIAHVVTTFVFALILMLITAIIDMAITPALVSLSTSKFLN